MKKHLNTLFAAAAFVTFSASCDLTDIVDINFTTDQQSVDFIIEPASAGNYFEQVEVVTTDIKNQIEDNGGSIDNLKSIKVSDLTVEVVSGAANLDAFESFEINIVVTGAAEKKMAWLDEVPLSVTSASPSYIDEDIKDYIGQDTYTITLSGILRSDITADVVLRTKAHFEVTL
jgi:hypothetical protein